MKKYLIKYIILFVLFYVLCMAYVGVPECKVFGFGALFALIICGYSYIALGAYLPAYMLANMNLYSIIVSLITLAICVVIIEVSKKHKIHTWIYYILAFVSQSAMLFVHLSAPRLALTWLVALLLGELFMAVSVVSARVVVGHKLRQTLTADEKIALGVVGVVLALGLNACKIYVSPLTIVAFVAMYICVFCLDVKLSFVVAIIFGLGASINSFSPLCLAWFCLSALVMIAFKSNYRIISSLATIALSVAFTFYFGADNIDYYRIIDVGVASVVFMLVPQKVLNVIKNTYSAGDNNMGSKSMVNKARDGVCRRLDYVAQVFTQMGVTYRGLIKGSLPAGQAKEVIESELISKVCAHCKERNKCMRVDGKISAEIFDDMLETGLARGKVTLLDIPGYLTGKCNNLNVLLNTLNALLKNYFNYANMIKNTDESKLLISDNLIGVSDILKSLSKEVSENVTFDSMLEKRIAEDLMYKNIVAKEVVVYMSDLSVTQITIVVSSVFDSKADVEKCVSKTCALPLEIVDQKVDGGCTVLNLRQKPNYDIVFGISSSAKDGGAKNGDSHSVIKIAPGKYMVALSDGMGTGEGAHSTSALALGLIENFYRAGFDSDMILSTVNKLLSIDSTENYSTLDLCVMDLYKGTLDFVKLGAPFALIQSDSGVQVVEGSGLPIGVLEEMKPHITKKLVHAFDNIIIFSDGIVDAFKGKEELINFVDSIHSSNPQNVSDMILDRAVDLCEGNLIDDMTVLAVRIYPT